MSSIIFGAAGRHASKYKNKINLIKAYFNKNNENIVREYAASNLYCYVMQSKEDPKIKFYRDNNEGVFVAISGNVYNDKEVRGSTDAERTLNAYRKKDNRTLALLRGIYAGIVHDNKTNESFLFNDILGLQPMFYTIKDGVLFFSSEAESFIEGHLVEPLLNYDALAELMTMNFTIGDSTLIRNVRRILPASIITISDNTISFNNIMPRFRQQLANTSYSDCINDVDYLINDAVNTIYEYASEYGKKIELALSGGLDCRMVLHYFLKNKLPFKAITGYDPNGTYIDDLNFSKSLSDKYKFEHDIYKSGGRATRISNILVLPVKNLKKTVEFTGYAGEVMKGYYYTQTKYLRTLDIDQRLEQIFSSHFISKLTNNPLRTAKNYIKSEESEDTDRCKELFFLDHLGSFFRNERPPQHKPKILFLNYSHFPFLDRNLIEYIQDMPLDTLKYKNFYLEYFKTISPTLFSLPSTTVARTNVTFNRTYQGRTTKNDEQYVQYYNYIKDHSRIWRDDMFSGISSEKDDVILNLLVSLWHDHYFRHRDSMDGLYQIENERISSQLG